MQFKICHGVPEEILIAVNILLISSILVRVYIVIVKNFLIMTMEKVLEIVFLRTNNMSAYYGDEAHARFDVRNLHSSIVKTLVIILMILLHRIQIVSPYIRSQDMQKSLLTFLFATQEQKVSL